MKDFFVYKKNMEEKIQELRQYMMSHEKVSFWIKVEPILEKRTTLQNSFFHGPVLNAFCRLQGESDKHYVKSVLKSHFLTKDIGGGKSYIQDTSELNTKEMSEFIESCLSLLSQMGGHLTNTEQEHFEAYRDSK